MATLECTDTGRIVRLKGWHLVGRRGSCDLQLSSRRISSEHAVIAWDGERWQIRDLGSKNGTWLGEGPIAAGISHPLEAGATLRFADGSTWRVRSLEPPEAMAIPVDGSAPALSDRGGPIGLPDDEQPLASVVCGPDGRWALEREDGTVEQVSDGDTVLVGGQAWRLSLPETIEETWDLTPGAPHISSLTMRFRVSMDLEHIDLELIHGDQIIPARARKHNELLLELARQRLEDQTREDIPADEHGWLYADELQERLRIFDNRIYVWIHRARKQLSKLGVEGAAQLVERRPDSGQVRLGVGRVLIQQAGGTA